jgi:arylsulfatase A-like enzyme
MANVLLLWTDQQRWDSLAGYGNDWLPMPHLNALARDSTVFERAYCSSPVCTPSRGSVLTGLLPHAHGARINNLPLHAEVRCLPELLADGRATGYFGKWHLGDEIYPQHGFAEWQSSEDGYQEFFSAGRDQADRSHFHHHLVARGYRPDRRNLFERSWCMSLPERDSKPAFLASHAVDFVQRHRDRPWLLSVNTLEPHHPLMGPCADLIDPDRVPTPPDFLQDPGPAAPLSIRAAHARWAHEGFEDFHLRTPASWRQLAAHYWSQCHHVDRQYGRILAALRDTGQYDDTLIVFCSDHGECLGSHGLFGKGVPYETSARVPLLVKLPGQREPRREARPVSLVDVTPTVLDVLGATVPAGLHGRSLLPLCRGGAAPPRDVVIHWHRDEPADPARLPAFLNALGPAATVAAARNCSYRCLVTPSLEKFTLYETGEASVFDLKADPHELADRVSILSAAQRAAWAERLSARCAADGDDFVIPAGWR